MGARHAPPQNDAPRVASIALAVLLIAAWLTLTTSAAVVSLMVASLSVATFFGEPPTVEQWREGIAWCLAGGVAAAAGPLGVWFFHRRRGWLWAAMAAPVLHVICAVYILVSFGVD